MPEKQKGSPGGLPPNQGAPPDLSILKKLDFSKLKRSDLLPVLFSINSKPYSLDNFLQFKTLFDGDYVPESIYISGRQVSKSVSLAHYEALNCMMIPHYQVLYVAPLKDQAARFSVMYLQEAIQTCSLARMLQTTGHNKRPAGPIIKTITHQAFSNGSGIQLTYAKTSADRARGIFCDELDCDEIQDHLIDNLAIIKQSLTQSDWGIRRYTGTAKTIDNTIEYLWQQSSMSEWAMKCGGCGHWNIPNLDGRVLDMIQIDGPCCIKCGKRLDVSAGQFVPAIPHRINSFVGYHIPQIIIPNIVNSERRWGELVNKLLKEPPATFMQEVLGISNSTGARLISLKDIEKCCVLPDMADMQTKLSGYTMTIGGVDWGVAEQTSFTVHTIIGIRPDGKIDVLWAKRFSGFDPDEVMSQIVKAQRFYKCSMCLDSETLVLVKSALTGPCYKRIVDVTTTDRVWDGHDWVNHDGVKLVRNVTKNELTNIGNTRLTLDHKVYINDCTSRSADTLSMRGRASAMAWRQSTAPISRWHNVRLLASALGRAVSRFVCTALRKACRKN